MYNHLNWGGNRHLRCCWSHLQLASAEISEMLWWRAAPGLAWAADRALLLSCCAHSPGQGQGQGDTGDTYLKARGTRSCIRVHAMGVLVLSSFNVKNVCICTTLFTFDGPTSSQRLLVRKLRWCPHWTKMSYISLKNCPIILYFFREKSVGTLPVLLNCGSYTSPSVCLQ